MTFPEPDFEKLFVTHYDSLVRSLTAITGDREMARDCVQDAFIKAASRWRRVRRYDNPVTWIRRVAINRSRDLHRAQQRRQRRERRVASVSNPPMDDGPGWVDDSMRLVELLGDLPERQRSAAALFYVEDLAVADIAVALGISDGAVKFHLNKAREALRGAIEQEGQRYG